MTNRQSSASDAVLLKLTDQEMQRYVQRYPFATGPDEFLNHECRRALATSTNLRNHSTAQTELKPAGITLPSGWEKRSRELFQSLGWPTSEHPSLLQEYGWKVSGIPQDSTSILSIGCGDGSELAVIRAAFPNAVLHAIDWECKVSPEALKELDVTFETANFVELLARENRIYDAIFSSHVLEHLFDPETTLKQLRDWLRPGGSLVSALPMESDPDRPFIAEMLRILREPSRIKQIDLDLIDLGHPWKTNVQDLAETLSSAGYLEIEFRQRVEHVARIYPGTSADCLRLRKRGVMWCRLLLDSPRAMLRLMPAIPLSIRKLVFAIESRLWFGHARLKTVLAPEVLFVGRR